MSEQTRCPTCGSDDPKGMDCPVCGEPLPWHESDKFSCLGRSFVACPDPFHRAPPQPQTETSGPQEQRPQEYPDACVSGGLENATPGGDPKAADMGRVSSDAVQDERFKLARRFRDWVHESPLSQCSTSADTCPDWPLAYELADIAASQIATLKRELAEARLPSPDEVKGSLLGSRRELYDRAETAEAQRDNAIREREEARERVEHLEGKCEGWQALATRAAAEHRAAEADLKEVREALRWAEPRLKAYNLARHWLHHIAEKGYGDMARATLTSPGFFDRVMPIDEAEIVAALTPTEPAEIDQGEIEHPSCPTCGASNPMVPCLRRDAPDPWHTEPAEEKKGK